MSTVADSIRRGLAQATAFVEGKADPGSYRVHVPKEIDVKAIRTKLAMTQEQFAGRFGFSINRCGIGSRAHASQKGRREPIYW